MEEQGKKGINDYLIMKKIGDGAFGTVYLAQERATQLLVAIKALDKQHIVKTNKSKHVYREKEILIKLAPFPFIIKLETTFQVFFIFESVG